MSSWLLYINLFIAIVLVGLGIFKLITDISQKKISIILIVAGIIGILSSIIQLSIRT
ncbi:hypothetical protein [Paenibacillus sp. Leaf72]|uniref:hypothetical protein n=1 Tax=Paenibacillus sp. Leaf72 TaxID=1736234 RepID=UPI000B28AA5A|nr:hypothetical protein [Paenibacillus sp. Leaf72]